MKQVYLDHNATTPTDPEVVRAMAPYYTEIYGNASSVHMFGQKARRAVEAAREQVANFLGAKDSQEIVFTSGGTESDNLAIRGIAYALRSKGNHIITSSIEHHAVETTCKALEKEGFKVTYIPVDKEGIVDLEALKGAITDKTILISIMWANNEMGTIEPIEEIAKVAKGKGVLFHTDAVQAVGKIPVNVEKVGIDLLSLSAHKFYGPNGIGALYIRKGTKIQKQMFGGHHEKNRRAGTENVPGIIGLAKACELAGQRMNDYGKDMTELRDRLWEGIRKNVPHVKMSGHPKERVPNTVNVSFEYLEGESIILNLDMEGVAVSTGSACTSGSLEPSHVLTAMGIDAQTAQGSIRFSLGKDNTKEDIDYVVSVLPDIIKRLRGLSPLYKEQ
ncbi:MAG: cysteine desulfurase NifS [Candidatus Omnitrophica bacterium]|nr:cysteine desulfurase NifS [Candidatus Omnitrophota bacterium]